MTEFLTFRLYGSMASWGEIAVGDQRLSQTHPSKSAVLGLIAAALGICRNEEEKLKELSNGYFMAVRVDSEGALLRDFHTVQVPKPDRGRQYRTRKDELNVMMCNTILSQRDYRVDAHYSIVIYSNEGPYTLNELAEALKKPKFVLYLGRKSCPLSLPLLPRVVNAESLKDIFDQCEINDGVFKSKNLTSTNAKKITSYYWEKIAYDKTGFPSDGTYLINETRDQLSSRKRWQFVSRKEYQLIVSHEGVVV